MQVLFALDVIERKAGSDAVRPAAQEVYDSIAAHFEMPEAAKAFAKELVCGASGARELLDAEIAGVARNWRIERMAVVDRNVLRLGAYELMHTETPPPVVLDEAVRLAQRFGADSSPAFVNGVLDAIARRARGCDT